jgi:hypothetical protein
MKQTRPYNRSAIYSETSKASLCLHSASLYKLIVAGLAREYLKMDIVIRGKEGNKKCNNQDILIAQQSTLHLIFEK